MILKKVRIGP